MSIRAHVRKLRPIKESYTPPVEKVQSFLFEAKSYKHLSVSGSNQWEYLYPKLTYNISGLNFPNIKSDINIKN